MLGRIDDTGTMVIRVRRWRRAGAVRLSWRRPRQPLPSGGGRRGGGAGDWGEGVEGCHRLDRGSGMVVDTHHICGQRRIK